MKILLYHGRDENFPLELKKEALKLECQIFCGNPAKEELVDLCLTLNPHIVVIDAASPEKMIETVRWLKSCSIFRETLFAAFCKTESELRDGARFLASGVSFLHLAGLSCEEFMQDCFQIAFDEKKIQIPPPAEYSEVSASLGIVSAFSAINSAGFYLETDIALTNSVTLRAPMTGNEEEVTLPIVSTTEGGVNSPFARTYEVRFPYPGPEAELNESTLYPETVETWIDLKEDQFDPRTQHLCVFTRDKSFLKELYKHSQNSWYQVFRNTEEAVRKLYRLSPGIIFFDLVTADGPDLNQLKTIIGSLKEMKRPPMLIIFGTRSESEALRKIFDYPLILAVTQRLEMKLFSSFESMFLGKHRQVDSRYLKPKDEQRICYLENPVILNSLEKNVLSFMLDEDIPPYAIARFSEPFVGYVTIIPDGQTPSGKKNANYQGILHGMSLAGKEKIRLILSQNAKRKRA